MVVNEKRIHSTKQRSAIMAVLDAAKGPLTAEEVWAIACKAKPGLGLRTVFRNLQEQVDEQALMRVVFPGHPPRYEKPAALHHPHFVCVECGSVFDLPGPTPDVAPLSLAPQSDFAAFDAAAYPRTIFPRR